MRPRRRRLVAGSAVLLVVAAPLAAAPLQLPDAGTALKTVKSLMSLAHPHLPAWAERWLYNPRERTAAAIDALKHGDARQAVADADGALRLAPDSNLTSYNAGSARLAGGDRKLAAEAAPLLDKAAAAKDAGRDLAHAASYNLGNARLAGGEYAGAIEAYKQALRLAPGDASAKFNLELAMQAEARQEQQNRQRALGPRGGGGTPRPGNQQQSAGQGGPGNPGSNPQSGKPDNSPNAGNQQQADRRPQGGGAGAQARPGPNGQPSPLDGQQPLPGYKDQPEMTASQAAAVLEAVENLERQQRREAAAREARRRSARGEDW